MHMEKHSYHLCSETFKELYHCDHLTQLCTHYSYVHIACCHSTFLLLMWHADYGITVNDIQVHMKTVHATVVNTAHV